MNDLDNTNSVGLESAADPEHQDRLSYAAIGLALMLILFWIIGAWTWVSNERRSRIDHYMQFEAARIDRQADTISENIGQNLGYLSGIPFVVAGNPQVHAALKQMSGVSPGERDRIYLRNRWSKKSELAEVSRHLGLIGKRLNVDLVWVMNDQGYCIAANNIGDTGSPIGASFTYRRYFRMAKEQGYGRQFAMGRTTNLPGLYFSTDIRDEAGNFLGVAAAKRNVGKLAHLIEHANAMITDELGVIILASDPSLQMKALPGGQISQITEQARLFRYRQDEFTELPLRQGPSESNHDLYLLGNDTVPLLMTVRHRPTDDIRIHVYSRLTSIAQIESDNRWMFLVMSAAGILLVLLFLGGALFVIRNRRQHRMLQDMNALLQHQAYTDQLTGCLNRRRWMELAALAVERTDRYGPP